MPGDETELTLARLVGAIGGLQRRLQPALAGTAADGSQPAAAAAAPGADPLTPPPRRSAGSKGTPPSAQRPRSLPSPTGRPPLPPSRPSPGDSPAPPAAQQQQQQQQQPQGQALGGGYALPCLPLHKRLWDRWAGAGADPGAGAGGGTAQIAAAASVLVARFAAFASDVLAAAAASCGEPPPPPLSAADALSVPALDAAFSAAVNEPHVGLVELMALTQVRAEDAAVLGPAQGPAVSGSEGAHFLWDGALVDLSDPRALSWGLGWAAALAQLGSRGRSGSAYPGAAAQCVALRHDAHALTGHAALAAWVEDEAPDLLAAWQPGGLGAPPRGVSGRHLVLAQLVLEAAAQSMRAAAASYLRACRSAEPASGHSDERACRSIAAIRDARAAAAALKEQQSPQAAARSSPARPMRPAPERRSASPAGRCASPRTRAPQAAGTPPPRSRSADRTPQRRGGALGVRLRGGSGAALLDSSVGREIDAGTGGINYGNADLPNALGRRPAYVSGVMPTPERDRAYFFTSEFMPPQRLGKTQYAHSDPQPQPPRQRAKGAPGGGSLFGALALAPPSEAPRGRASPARGGGPAQQPWGSPQEPQYNRPRGRRTIEQPGSFAHGQVQQPQQWPVTGKLRSASAGAPPRSAASLASPQRRAAVPPEGPCPFGTLGAEGPALRYQRRVASPPRASRDAADAAAARYGRQRTAAPQGTAAGPPTRRRGVAPPSAADSSAFQGAGMVAGARAAAAPIGAAGDSERRGLRALAPPPTPQQLAGTAIRVVGSDLPPPPTRGPSPSRKGRAPPPAVVAAAG